ncbi:hypothetical protein JRI60_19830 [Archangium violaceum]|uniref:hypothetical protein n=1 Tax=Archangium violaceum TaxID=83451 RepID=UPI00194FDDAF|nr:hypothetical protein [Archangium violaceum]QRO01122.1 hypothetical protein JRI60_19830 [Archangium violaceum]
MQTRMKLLLLVTWGLGGGLGFLVGRGSAPLDTHDELRTLLERQGAQLTALEARLGPASRQVHCAVAAPGGGGLDAAWLRAELSRILEEELGPRRAKAGQEPAPEPSTESVASLQEGHRLIDEASRARRWTEEDARELRRMMGGLSGAQREELMRRFAVFVNAGGVDVQVRGPPF